MKIKCLAILLLANSILGRPALMAADTIIVVVRHAEKATDDPKDPSRSEQGEARANKLAAVLKDADLKAVYTTQYKRTKLTGTPAASQSGLQVQVREANQKNADTYVDDLLKEIQKQHKGETVLVVGHSNTVPDLVKRISGQEVPAIGENEFDRIYIITLAKKPRLLSVTYHP